MDELKELLAKWFTRDTTNTTDTPMNNDIVSRLLRQSEAVRQSDPHAEHTLEEEAADTIVDLRGQVASLMLRLVE